MNINKIKTIIELMRSGGVAEIEISNGTESLRVSQFMANTQGMTTTHMPAPIIAHSAGDLDPTDQEQLDPTAQQEAALIQHHTVNSPMVGTIYLSPSPESGAFVKVGQNISEGDVLCTVEAMKMFNQIEADRGGKILECLVENGQTVEYDQPLFVIE